MVYWCSPSTDFSNKPTTIAIKALTEVPRRKYSANSLSFCASPNRIAALTAYKATKAWYSPAITAETVRILSTPPIYLPTFLFGPSVACCNAGLIDPKCRYR